MSCRAPPSRWGPRSSIECLAAAGLLWVAQDRTATPTGIKPRAEAQPAPSEPKIPASVGSGRCAATNPTPGEGSPPPSPATGATAAPIISPAGPRRSHASAQPARRRSPSSGLARDATLLKSSRAASSCLALSPGGRGIPPGARPAPRPTHPIKPPKEEKQSGTHRRGRPLYWPGPDGQPALRVLASASPPPGASAPNFNLLSCPGRRLAGPLLRIATMPVFDHTPRCWVGGAASCGQIGIPPLAENRFWEARAPFIPSPPSPPRIPQPLAVQCRTREPHERVHALAAATRATEKRNKEKSPITARKCANHSLRPVLL